MLEVIHWYMKCSVTVNLTITDSKGCKHSVGEMEVPIQDAIVEALENSGHWMFTK